MSNLVEHSVRLTDNNRRKFHKGEPTLLTHDQIVGGPDRIYLTKQQSRKLMRAARKGKGVKLHLSTKELQASMMSGEGLSWKGFKRGAKRAFKKVAPVLKEMYHDVKPYVAPRLKQGIHAGVDFLAGAASTYMGAPEAAPFVATAVNNQADKLAHKIGAYGFQRRRVAHAHHSSGEAWLLSSGKHPTFEPHDTRFRSPMIGGGSFLTV